MSHVHFCAHLSHGLFRTILVEMFEDDWQADVAAGHGGDTTIHSVTHCKIDSDSAHLQLTLVEEFVHKWPELLAGTPVSVFMSHLAYLDLTNNLRSGC